MIRTSLSGEKQALTVSHVPYSLDNGGVVCSDLRVRGRRSVKCEGEGWTVGGYIAGEKQAEAITKLNSLLQVALHSR